MPVYRDDQRNTFYVSIRKKDSVTGELKHVTKRGFQTKKAAKEWEAEQLLSQDNSTTVSFKAMNKQFVAYKNARPGTQHQELMRLEKYFGDYCGKPITKIQKKDLLQWQIWLDSQPISTVTKNFMISSIKGTYRFANAFYGIPDISMVLKRFKKKQEEKKEMQTWTPDEFEKFIAQEENPYYICYFNFLYWTGARRSEALGLRKQDFNGNKVHIWHSIKNFKDGFLPLKNSASERTIVMDDKLTELMQQCLDRCTEDAPFVFGGEATLPIRTIQNHFEANIKKSGVKKIRLHDLRHSHASLLINNNVNVLAVSRRLGHATIQQTLETYAHLFASTEDQMMETLDKLHNP